MTTAVIEILVTRKRSCTNRVRWVVLLVCQSHAGTVSKRQYDSSYDHPVFTV